MNCQKTGAFIAHLRKNAALTQVQLAEKMGVTNSAVSKWERGVCYPDIEIVSKLAEYFAVSVNEILAGEHLHELTKETADNITKESVQCYSAEIQRRVSRKAILAGISVMLACVLLFAAVLGSLIGVPVSGLSAIYTEYCELYSSDTVDIGQLLVQYELNGERRTVSVNVLTEKGAHGLREVDILKAQVMESGQWPLDVSVYCDLKSLDHFQIVMTISAQERELEHRTVITEVYSLVYFDGRYTMEKN